MDRIRFVTHHGLRILLVDCTNCEADELTELADRVPDIVTQEPLGSLLIAADFTDADFTREAIEHIKIAAAFDRPHVKRTAWVLTGNMPKALFDSIRSFSARQLPVFATLNEALDYLVS